MDKELPLIRNLESQLKRLINELEDLEETKHELEEAEYLELKSEFLDQTREFSEALNRMLQGDVTVTSKYTVMKQDLRRAIGKAFNATEIIKIFGCKTENELESQLICLKKEFKLKKLKKEDMETKKIEILNKIRIQNEKNLSSEDLEFLQSIANQELAKLISIEN